MSARRDARDDVALVTDGFVRKSLAAVRSLGRRGVRVIACATTPLAPALLSRYAWRRVVHPPLATDPEGCLGALEEACRRFRPRSILAMEEETLTALLGRRERFAALGARLPYAPLDTVQRLGDKAWTTARARSLGIPVPRTWEDPRRAAAEAPADAELVVKPRRGSGAFGVRYVHGTRALLEGWREGSCPGRGNPSPTPPAEGSWLIQERLRGPGVGVSLLYDEEGRCRAQFAHRRLREWPSQGGASTLRESARLPEVEARSRALLEDARFVGPAMVEWKIDARDGEARLLEVNPRFWGSLALAIRAGVDFPWLLHRIACGAALPPQVAHEVGVRARWFLPGDAMHFLERGDWRGLLRSLWPGAEPDAPDDIFDARDLSGALGALLFTIPFALRPEFRRFRRLERA